MFLSLSLKYDFLASTLENVLARTSSRRSVVFKRGNIMVKFANHHARNVVLGGLSHICPCLLEIVENVLGLGGGAGCVYSPHQGGDGLGTVRTHDDG